MVRHHGWQLPAHTFQVVAITVFFLLVVAFYAFFAPFIGQKILEYICIAAYSPVALAVFILYVRCTRINPADPGIMAKFDANYTANNNSKPQSMDLAAIDNPAHDEHSLHSLEQRSPGYSQSARIGSAQVAGRLDHLPTSSKKTNACFAVGGIFCAIFAVEDCRKECSDQQASGEDALFCTLCNSEVRRFSKHCRSCDKCVDGFDHHCRWLNNCVGRKNYVSFIALMATSLLWLIIEVGVGIAVLVLCFVNKKGTEDRIVEKLGNGFSRAPFAAVVAVCTAVSLLAVIPLGELFFFHLLLMKKGITTYEYVVAMRAMSEVPPESANEDNQNVLYSPSGSTTTGFSGASSLGLHLQYKGVWCTPPRIFVDQDEVVPHLEPGMVPSTIDPDAGGPIERGNKMPKKAVKISAWKLAKLDSDEAMKAAAKARASSSILRPVAATSRLPDNDISSSGNISVRSSISTDYGPHKEVKNDLKVSPLRNFYSQSYTGKEDYDTGTQSVSSFSSPGHVHESVALSPLPSSNLVRERPAAPRLAPVTAPLTNPVFQSAISFVRDTRRTSVVWDQEAGRYVSVPVTTRPENVSDAPVRAFRTSANPIEAAHAHTRRPVLPDSQFPNAPRRQPPERLSYTGESIFFGGPLLNAPIRDIRRDSDGIDHRGISTFQNKLSQNPK